jgi:hypothetical protein
VGVGSRTGPISRFRATSVLATSLVFLIAPILAAPAAAIGHSRINGSNSGTLCPVTGAACITWEERSNGTEPWNSQVSKELTPGGGSMSAEVSAKLTQQVLEDGTLGTATMTATIDTNVVGGGTARPVVQFNGNFETTAPTIQVIGSASTEAHGTAALGGGASIVVSVDCESDSSIDTTVQSSAGASGGAAGVPMDASDSKPLGGTVAVASRNGGLGSCSVNASLATSAGTNRPASGTDNGSAKATISLTILAAEPLATPSSCGLKGSVVDGGVADGHQNPLRGIRVELRRNDATVGPASTTDGDGGYCLPAPPDPAAGDYKVRATLIDAAHDPPLFETRFATEPDATFVEAAVGNADFGGADKDITFTTAGAGTSSVARNLADIANLHYQSERFIGWVLAKLDVLPATFGHVTVVTFDSTNGDRSFEDDVTSSVHIADIKSPYSTRSLPNANGPENAEWHEITHYLEFRLGIAAIESPACAGRQAHGGWLNTSTCDSLQEGFAMFLPTLASLDLDATTGQGYGTPDYAGFGSLEDNAYWPWILFPVDGHTEGREDLAVAQLLWDLIDDTPDESPIVDWFDAGTGLRRSFVTTTDGVAIGGMALVKLLIAAKPLTVTDIFDALQSSPLVPAALKSPTEPLTAEASPKISLLEELFLEHGFEPVHDASNPAYVPGDPVSRTDHVPAPSGGLVVRHDIAETRGAAIRFVNGTSAPVTFTLEITYPQTSSRFPITVAATSSLLVHQEVPPYWREALAPAADLPSCGAKDQRLVTITVSAPGVTSRSIDSCSYLHAARVATDGAALTFDAGGQPVASSPLPVAGVIAALALAVVVAFSVLALRRRARPKGNGGA